MIVRRGNRPDLHVDLGPAYGRTPGSHSGVLAIYGIPPNRRALEGIGHAHGDPTFGPRGEQSAWKDRHGR